MLDSDLKKMADKEQEQEIRANRVIQKLNSNSERVLTINKKVGMPSVDLLDDRTLYETNNEQQTKTTSNVKRLKVQ